MGAGDRVLLAPVTPECSPRGAQSPRGLAPPHDDKPRRSAKGMPALLPPMPLAAMDQPKKRLPANLDVSPQKAMKHLFMKALTGSGYAPTVLQGKASRAAARAREIQDARITEWSDAPLREAVLTGNAKEARKCLLRGMDPNGTDDARRPLLHLACHGGHHDVVQHLIKLGATVNCPDPTRDHQTPLHTATVQNHHEIVLYLMLSGADVNAQDAKGRAPLHLAAQTRCRILCEYLLGKGADAKLVDDAGFTAAEYFTVSDHIGVVDRNITGAVLSEHYLTKLFQEHAQGRSYITCDEFRACWEKLDTMGVPLRLPYVARKTGRIAYTQFCVEMLKIAQW
eukprot:TRINITY_DN10854_c0_g1_i2.p1 TRINITY_DN10854_c0_g1~~TRINITY_DN10854_c0_g1_i2.p1  ORF type:complete len:339 (+),score=54.40 TRINITY_DN10854_c0_g1_i2:28-1044(+)